jgi:hypothetical protein
VFDELFDIVFPGGAFVAVGVAIGATFSKQLRPVAKQAIKAGMTLSERMREAAAEASERAQDLMAEAQMERTMEMQQATNGEGTAEPEIQPVAAREPRTTRSRAGAATQAH